MSVLKSLKNLASDSLIYGLSGVLTRFIGVFLTPIYTRIYTVEDYGIIGILTNSYMLVSVILVLAMDNSTARWFYETENRFERKQIINTWIWFYLFISVFASIYFIFSANFWANLILEGYEDGTYLIKLLAISLPLLVWPSVGVNVLRFERKAKQAVFLSLFQSLILIGLNILFVVILRKGVAGVYYAQLLGAAITLPVAAYFLRSWLGAPRFFNLSKFKAMFTYGMPFIPASLGYWIVNLSGVFFVNEYLNKSEVGLYQIGISIAAVAGLATTAFQQAWSPFAFSIINQPNSRKIYAASLQIYVLIVGLICTVISIFAHEALVILTTPDYYNAAVIASILTFNYLLMGLSNISGLGAAIAKKTAPMGMISLVSAGVLITLNFLLIPYLGKEGAALSICIAQAVIPLYMFWKSQQYYFIPYDFLKNTVTLSIFITVVLISYLIPQFTFIVSFGMKVGLILTALGLISLLIKKELSIVKLGILKIKHR